MKRFISLLFTLHLCACAVGPDYVRPNVCVPTEYKESGTSWKVAKPDDRCQRGEWWTVFNDPTLNLLEARLNCSNQNIATACAQYRQALAIVREVKAGFFPVVTATESETRQRQVSAGTGSSAPSAKTSTSYSFMLNASWEPDFWGKVRRSVEASTATAQAIHAQLAVTRLSMQATLAQLYFLSRTLDLDQTILNNNVRAYQKALKISKNRYNAGVVGRADVIQAQSLVDTSQAQAINNGIARAQYEHAIAVLIGQPASSFTMASNPLKNIPPVIPVQLPSELLERRPDVAQAERLMAAANAEVGVAISAYFPVLSLTAAGSTNGPGLGPLFSWPTIGWALGQQLFQTAFDGGLRRATTAAARANYDATVASYRQTVLAAFQDVEDNLSTLRILEREIIVQNRAVESARKALNIVMNEYKSGTASFSDVITSQTLLYTAEKNAADIAGQRMTATVGLIKGLGGGWDSRRVKTTYWF